LSWLDVASQSFVTVFVGPSDIYAASVTMLRAVIRRQGKNWEREDRIY